MDYFHLLETFASEVFNCNAMGRHRQAAHYLSAVATLSQALARRQLALAEIDQYQELLERTLDENCRTTLLNLKMQSERDRELVELELGGVDLWINTLSGSIVGKDQFNDALKVFAERVVTGTTFNQVLSCDDEMDRIVAGLVPDRNT